MSYRHYTGGEPQRVQRHQQQYDPFAESDRYGGAGQGRRDGYAREEPPRSSGNGYGGGGSYGSSGGSISRQPQGYPSGRSQSGSYSSSHGYGTSAPVSASLPRARESGFPSGIQESDVWRTNTSTNAQQQQRSSRQAVVSYTQGRGREEYGQAWGGDQMSRSGQQPTYSYKGAGGVMTPAANQPVLMMVPQGTAGGLMGLVANPFAVPRNAAAGMQMITIPGLNPNVFDQQHLMGSGQFSGSHHQQQHHGTQQPRSGRHSDRGPSAPHGGSGRESRVSSSSRGHGTSAVARRRSSPGPGRGSTGGGPPRNAVYRKPLNINPPSSSLPRKRVSDRADFGERKKLRRESEPVRPAASTTTTGSANSSPTKRLNGNQKRKDKRKRDAEAKLAAAAASGTKAPTTPKKAEQKQQPEGKEEKKEVTTTTAEGTKETENTEVIAVGAEKKGEVEVVVLDEAEATTGKAEEEKRRKSKYDDFPAALLVCKVCQKSMNDGASFESHLSGRAHTALVKIVEERFDKRAELLMIESRLAEEEIGIELERQRRAGKSGGNSSKSNSHCKMCDCNYTVNWGTHKISLGHRILKEFLHPSCRYCDANFVHRMDWVNHLFGLAHLRRVAEQRNAGKDTSSHESQTQEELFTINLEMNQEEKPANFLTIRNLDWKVPTPSHIKDLLQEETELQVPEGEIVIPSEHDGTVVIGKEAIISTTGYCCKVCRTYMTQEKEVDPHCMGKSHFGMYVSYLKKLAKMQEEQKAGERKAAEEKAAAVEAGKKKTEEEQKAEVKAVTEVKEEDKEVKSYENGPGIVDEEEMELGDESVLAGEEEDVTMDTGLDESLLLDESVDEEVTETPEQDEEKEPVDEKEKESVDEKEKQPVDEKEKESVDEKEPADEKSTVAEVVPVTAEVTRVEPISEKEEKQEMEEEKKVEEEKKSPVEVVAEVKVEVTVPNDAPTKAAVPPPMTPKAKAQAATLAGRGTVGRGRGSTPGRSRGVPTRGGPTPTRGTAIRGGNWATRGSVGRAVRGSPRRPVGARGRGGRGN